MSSVTLISKNPAGGAGNFEYEFSCTCSNGTLSRNIILTAANDVEARMIAELECQALCGELLVEQHVSGNIYERNILASRPDRCLQFVLQSTPDRVALYNSCRSCKVAVIMVVYYNDAIETERVRVPAEQSVLLNSVNVKRRQILREEEC